MELSVLSYFGKGFDVKTNFLPVSYSCITHQFWTQNRALNFTSTQVRISSLVSAKNSEKHRSKESI